MNDRSDHLRQTELPVPPIASGPRFEAILALIEPAKSMKHSGATLWSHLVGTFEVLSAWGAPRDVCFAGALHSIYSTQYFSGVFAKRSQRGEVARLVGRRVEHLAHAFCTIDRESIRAAATKLASQPSSVYLSQHSSNDRVRVAKATLRQLRLMEIANEMEQRKRLIASPEPYLSDLAQAYREIDFSPIALPLSAITTSPADESELLRSYAKGLGATGRRASTLFARCVAAVPCCAEPRLMLANSFLATGQLCAAYSHSRQALAHIRGWAIAWDNRVPPLAWEVLALQLMDAAKRGSRRPPPLADQIKARLLEA